MKNSDDLLSLDPNAITKRFSKGEIIQKAGDKKTHAYFIKSGLLRSYIIDSKGKEHIYLFAPENWFIGDMEAMEFDQPAELYIECLEDSEIILFDKDRMFHSELSKDQILSNAHIVYRRIARLQRRVLMMVGSPAADRYAYFLTTYPELANRIPQHMIASFLGIAPQTLSKIRGNRHQSE